MKRANNGREEVTSVVPEKRSSEKRGESSGELLLAKYLIINIKVLDLFVICVRILRNRIYGNDNEFIADFDS